MTGELPSQGADSRHMKGVGDMGSSRDNSTNSDWLDAELADILDEDYELEMSEPALSMEIRRIYRKLVPHRCPATRISGLCCPYRLN
jgi:hypothetical protein